MSKKQLGVIFGSRSCEREVAIISAVQLMRHINPEKYETIPIYIDENGIWYTGEPLKEIDTFKAFNPKKKRHPEGLSGPDRRIRRTDDR